MTFMAGFFLGLFIGGGIGAVIMAIFKMAVEGSSPIPPSICRGTELNLSSSRQDA
jgi:hypothetical protein